MDAEKINYKLFEIDEAVKKFKQKKKEDREHRNLKRPYKMKPEDVEGETIGGEPYSLKDKMKKLLSGNKL